MKEITKIYRLKGLKPPKKGHTNFYECCDLTKKVYLTYKSISKVSILLPSIYYYLPTINKERTCRSLYTICWLWMTTSHRSTLNRWPLTCFMTGRDQVWNLDGSFKTIVEQQQQGRSCMCFFLFSFFHSLSLTFFCWSNFGR